MRRISSGWTVFNKKIFPLLWFGFLFFFFVAAWPAYRRTGDLMLLIMPVLLAVGGYFIMKKLVFGLADEVWDRGDALVVKNKNDEVLIPIADIMNVSYTTFTNPNRVTLTLRQPCRFGQEVSFMPPARLLPFAKSPIIEELIQRIDSSRRS